MVSVSNLTSVYKSLGSLRLAVILLLLLMMAMAWATIYESAHGMERVQAEFYDAWWFQGLLGLLGLNLVVSVVSRAPFRRRHIGFVLGHLCFILILVGGLVSDRYAIRGQVAIQEGSFADTMSLDESVIMIRSMGERAESSASLDKHLRFVTQPVSKPVPETLRLGQVEMVVEQYLPDSTASDVMVSDPQRGRPAVEMVLSASEESISTWAFDNHPAELAGLRLRFRDLTDEQALKEFATTAPAAEPAGKGTIRIEFEGETYVFEVDDCLDEPVPIGATGWTLQVQRYLPDARVTQDHRLENKSDRPVNPAVEVEIVGPNQPIRRPAFARFPDFWKMHGLDQVEGLNLVYESETVHSSEFPIEVVRDAEGAFHIRFEDLGAEASVHQLQLGVPIPLGGEHDPTMPGLMLTIREYMEDARRRRVVEPVSPPGKNPNPAVQLLVSAPDQHEEIWLRKHESVTFASGERRYELSFSDRQVGLGFRVHLADFQKGLYPGTGRPRSFSSSVTFNDPTRGTKQPMTVSMNHPAKFGGYTFFQSSYVGEEGEGPQVSILSAAYDPGQPIVFAGYFGMMIGVLWLVVQKAIQSRRQTQR